MSFISKKASRLKRAIKTRNRIRQQPNVYRLCVFRSLNHIYGQITSADGSITYVASSSLEPALKPSMQKLTGVEQAQKIGEDLAKKAISKGITKISFDRSGYAYHGRVKALAESLRSNGLEF